MDISSVLPFGLFPEKSILAQPPSREVLREEIKGYMEEVLEMVSERVDKAWPGHGEMSQSELVNWLQLSTTFMSVDDINDPDFSANISCAVLLLFFHWEKFELKDLVGFIGTARFIYTSKSYNSASYNYSFTSLLTPIMTRLYSV